MLKLPQVARLQPVTWQAPLLQTPELQTLPQVPQLLGSVRRLAPLQGGGVVAGGTMTVTVYLGQLAVCIFLAQEKGFYLRKMEPRYLWGRY